MLHLSAILIAGVSKHIIYYQLVYPLSTSLFSIHWRIRYSLAAHSLSSSFLSAFYQIELSIEKWELRQMNKRSSVLMTRVSCSLQIAIAMSTPHALLHLLLATSHHTRVHMSEGRPHSSLLCCLKWLCNYVRYYCFLAYLCLCSSPCDLVGKMPPHTFDTICQYTISMPWNLSFSTCSLVIIFETLLDTLI